MRSNSLKRTSRTTTTIAEVNEAAVAEGWEAQEGVLESAEIHNSIVTFLTPKTVARNLGDNLWISPLNSLNLNTSPLSSVDCCVFQLNGGHQMPWPHPSLHFLVLGYLVSQTREPAMALQLQTYHGEMLRIELGVQLAYP
jgi:hypothetical protein